MEAKAPTEMQKRPTVVAMKGHPGTGKSTVARALATALAWTLLDKDDIKQNLIQFQFQFHHHLNLTDNNVDSASASINEACYDVLWAMAKTQLLCGNSVIIDSPLSAPRHFDNAVALCRATGAHLLLLECRADANPQLWRGRIQERAQFLKKQQHQHKPASWEELQALIRGYHGSYDYPINDTPLLLLDLTAPAPAALCIDDSNKGHSEHKDYVYLLSRVVEWVRTTSASSSSSSLITHLP